MLSARGRERTFGGWVLHQLEGGASVGARVVRRLPVPAVVETLGPRRLNWALPC